MLALALLALALQQPAPPEPPAAPTAPPARVRPRPSAKATPPPATRADGPEAPIEEPALTGFDQRSGKRFTGDFDDTDVDDALRSIAEAADWSIVFPRGEHGTISARFKDAPVEDALRAVLDQAGLKAALAGTIVTVRVRRAAEGAREEASRTTREVEREPRRAERGPRGRAKDRVVQGDVAVRAGEVARDVVAIRGNIRVEPGAEARDAVAILGNVVLEPGAHARQAVAIGGDVRLGPGAEVEKDAVSIGGDVVREPSSEVGGETVGIGIPALSGLTGLAGSHLFSRPTSAVFVLAQMLAKFAVFFALGVLILVLFPRRVEVVATSFTSSPWKSVLTGVLGLVLTPIVIVLLVVTIIGIPLVPVAALLLVAAGVLGFTALAFHVGRSLPLRLERGTAVLQLAIGTAIVVLVTAVPVLGGMAWFGAALLTFGAVIRSRFGSQQPALPTSIPPGAPPPAPAA